MTPAGNTHCVIPANAAKVHALPSQQSMARAMNSLPVRMAASVSIKSVFPQKAIALQIKNAAAMPIAVWMNPVRKSSISACLIPARIPTILPAS